MPASTRCTSLGPSRETHSHVIEHQRRAYPPEQVYEHGGRTKSVHTCRAKTTRHGITSSEYVEPLFPPNSKLAGLGGRPRSRDKMWTLQLWVRGGGVRGNCVMQVWLLSCHSVSPPWVWTLFVRAPSGLHVLCVFLVLPCLHVCVHFTFVLVHAYASSTTRNQMTMCAYTEPRHARSTTAEQPTGQLNGPPRDKARGSPRDNRGMTRGTATGQPQWQPQERVLGPAAVRLKSRVPPTPGSTAKDF